MNYVAFAACYVEAVQVSESHKKMDGFVAGDYSAPVTWHLKQNMFAEIEASSSVGVVSLWPGG